MDRHDIIHFTTVQLRGPNAATSNARLALTSYSASPPVESTDGSGAYSKRITNLW